MSSFRHPSGKKVIALTLAIFITALIQAPPASVCSTQNKKQRKAAAKREALQRETPPVEEGAISTSQLAMPFKRAWQYLTDSASMLSPSIGGARIYLPLAGGRLLCLDRETGSLLWSSEPGGIITAPVLVGENFIYIATRNLTDDGSEAGGSLRAVDPATGLTVWLKDYQRPFTSPLEPGGNRIYAGNADGAFYALAMNNGNVVWKVETQNVVRSRALVTDEAIYFGGDDGALRAVEPEHGKLLWKHQAGGAIVGQPAIDERALYFGSSDGYVYSVDHSTGKLKWRSRTGAAVEASPVLAGGRLLVASFDNFVYALSCSTGDRVWKRRFESRIASAPIVQGDASLIAPLRVDYIAVFLNSDGRRVNFYQLDKEFEIVSDPVWSGNTLVLATNKGLVVASATGSAESQTRALKK